MNIVYCSLVVLASVSSFVFVIVTLGFVFKILRRYFFYSSIQQKENLNNENLNLIFTKGVKVFYKLSKWILRKIKLVNNVIVSIRTCLELHNIKSNDVGILSLLIALCLFTCVVSSLIFWSLITGVAIVVLLLVCLLVYVKNYNEKHLSKVRQQIPEAIRLMGTCFGAGLTISQTFDTVSHCENKQISKLFKTSTHILKTGGSISDCLEDLKSHSKIPELSFIALALNIQHMTGGSIRPVLDSAKEIADNKLELARLLQVKTAQAKLSSKIVIIMPFALLCVFSIVSPDFLSPFFKSTLGVLIFAVACIMEASGIIIVKRMLEVEA